MSGFWLFLYRFLPVWSFPVCASSVPLEITWYGEVVLRFPDAGFPDPASGDCYWIYSITLAVLYPDVFSGLATVFVTFFTVTIRVIASAKNQSSWTLNTPSIT